ncbi:MAG: ribonuclease P protein component [Chloracidobacterium sp.]|uniref:Ribonuclease P protein component n=1 Tax=Chloracidobacterium validum TaxID=2821543 RepID=A0ABX8B4Q7_9BACT|nr:ribonuclease P protein component [Chloracidobacterium validum]QUW01959.1 ribonuclease P protein component [Chloracidobacterium validum]
MPSVTPDVADAVAVDVAPNVERRGATQVSCRFTKQDRLLVPREFQRVYRHGKQLHSSFFTIFVVPNQLGRTRIGITTSRKLSKSAVVRNRCRRLIREVFRRQRATLPASWDMVVNAKFPLTTATYGLIEKEFARLMGKLATLTESRTSLPVD